MTGRDLAEVSAPREATPATIYEFIEQMKPQMARALPKHLDADRMARLALTLVRQTPKLALCSQESFGAALMTATALGLEPGVLDEAYLIPYGRECTFVVGYKGYVKLFWQHPLARHIDAQIVRTGDEFDYAKGLDPYLIHKPGDENAPWTHAYAVASLSTGARAFEVLTRAQIKKLRRGAEGPDPKFRGGDPMHWMERKTAIRQMMKIMPKSVTMAAAVQADELPGSELHARQIPQRINDRDPLTELDAGLGLQLESGEAVNESTGEVYVHADQVPQQEPEGWK